MEKLLKLLNEYQKKLNWRDGNKRNYEIYERELKDDNIRMNDLDDPYEGLNMYGGYAKARLISKQFGFIERLIDSDKIDNTWWNASLELYHSSYTMYESLLMVLAIQDNPTEFLISVLK